MPVNVKASGRPNLSRNRNRNSNTNSAVTCTDKGPDLPRRDNVPVQAVGPQASNLCYWFRTSTGHGRWIHFAWFTSRLK